MIIGLLVVSGIRIRMHTLLELSRHKGLQKNFKAPFFLLKRFNQCSKEHVLLAKAFNLSQDSICMVQKNRFNRLKIQFDSQKVSREALLNKLLALEESMEFDYNACSVFSDGHGLTLMIDDHYVDEFLNQIQEEEGHLKY